MSDRTITEIKGTHLEGKTNDDVEKVLIEHQLCPYLPTNLGKQFKNLDILYVMKSNVSHLTKDDLTGLKKLRIFDVSYNPIQRLEKDFFKGHGSLEIISFYDCAISFIEKGALDPLTNLKEGHFQFNVCIDYRGDDESLLPDLMREVKEYCGDPDRKDFSRKHTIEFYDDSHGDYSWERHNDFIIKSTAKPKKVKEVAPEESKSKPSDDSFVRRHAFEFISVLLVIIAALGFFLFKVNAFNRQNWR